ncbi:MAG: hypothetical protein MK160_00240 [Rhodobacteraceae bacterium]|nr:hypothetical protein [Paracoccaceae bacterium]
MKLVEETSIPLAALPMAAFKAHLRMGSGFAEDDIQDGVLEAFLRASIAAIESRTGKAIISREFRVTLHSWRNPTRQALPIAPVQSVSEVRRITQPETAEVVDPARYSLQDEGMAAWLIPVGSHLPVIPEAGRVEILVTAGFGTDWSDLPADLAQAVLLLAAHYYEFRHEVALKDGCMPFGVTSLTARYRPMRLGASQ